MWKRADILESGLCHRANRASIGALRHVFRFASRMGDGGFWFLMLAILPAVYGRAALPCDLALIMSNGLGLALYLALKRLTARPRPFVTHAGIIAHDRALDEYSFPSGHTMQAVSFSLQISARFPHLAPVLLPLAFLIALSRVALGLHYPTDVIAGAVLGTGLALLGLGYF